MIEGQELKWANLGHKTVCYLQYFSLHLLQYVLVAIFTADISRHVYHRYRYATVHISRYVTSHFSMLLTEYMILYILPVFAWC